MTYYLKYRPQRLEELDLKDVRESLKKIIRSGKIPHAFLFAGPKGSGKTSAARILAKIVNCEKRRRNSVKPCNKCKQCTSIKSGSNIDVIELDAASHRGIDDVRLLREAVKLASAKANKKVYIIDEAHMLTLEASNALLKTLEEPPDHVMFILATTNPEKLIETIRSRTTEIRFKKATLEEVVRSLERVVSGERIKMDKKVLTLIAKASDGSFRDAAKILEQLIAENKILDESLVAEFLFQKRAVHASHLLSLLAKKDTRAALAAVETFVEDGGSVKNLVEAVVARLRNGLLYEVGMGDDKLEGFSKDGLVVLIKLFSAAFSEFRDAVVEQIPVELAIVEWCQPEASAKGRSASSGDRPLDDEGSVKAQNPDKAGARKRKVVKSTVAEKSGKTLNRSPARQKAQSSLQDTQRESKELSVKENKVTEEVWARILAAIRPINTSTEALLRAAKPVGYDGATLTLGVFYRFHKERLEDELHRRTLEDAVASILGNPVRVVCRLAEQPKKEAQVKEKKENISSDVVLAEQDSVLTEGDDEDIIRVAKEIFGNS